MSEPYYQDEIGTIYQGHTPVVLPQMAPGSVQCVITSPPYWGLRDYGLEPQIWLPERREFAMDPPGGCEHGWGKDNIRDYQQQQATYAGQCGPKASQSNRERVMMESEISEHKNISQGQFCQLCNAWRGSLGLEPTPELYVKHMVEVFREVRRVLRKDGTLWLNLGDSYAQSGGFGHRNSENSEMIKKGGQYRQDNLILDTKRNSGLKPKDLVGIPWRVAFALQADGWYLRSDIIWSKPNPMSESVTDRPTKAHEYLFLLTKSARYFFDQEAVRESDKGTDHWRAITEGQKSLEPSGGLKGPHRGIRTPHGRNGSGRNIRTVWTIPTAPFPDAHFATFPPKLVEPCIKAGTPEKGCCPECGSPWERVTRNDVIGRRDFDGIDRGTDKRGIRLRCGDPEKTTIGWQPTCDCGLPCLEQDVPQSIPCVVLDPFGGSGTVGMVAEQLGRKWIIIDLSEKYCEMAKNRIQSKAWGPTEKGQANWVQESLL